MCHRHDAGCDDYLIIFKKLEAWFAYVNFFLTIKKYAIRKEYSLLVFFIDWNLFYIQIFIFRFRVHNFKLTPVIYALKRYIRYEH